MVLTKIVVIVNKISLTSRYQILLEIVLPPSSQFLNAFTTERIPWWYGGFSFNGKIMVCILGILASMTKARNDPMIGPKGTRHKGYVGCSEGYVWCRYKGCIWCRWEW